MAAKEIGGIGRIADGLALDAFSISDAFGVEYAVAYASNLQFLLPTQGTLSARLKLTLPANAVVDALELVVTARRADEAVAGEVAELRGTSLGSNKHEIVVDFGTVRTVAAVRFSTGAYIHRVDAWNGTAFPASTFDLPYNDPEPLPAGSIPNRTFARFTSERRTERLRITVSSQSTVAALLDALSVILPDSPKDLAITLDGGAPVFTLPGPAAKGAGAALSADAWNSANKRLMVLTDAFKALTGNPLDGSDVEHELVLTSREAGILEIAEHRRVIRRIRRARFGGTTTTTLSPDAEGLDELPLAAPDTPAGAVAEQVAFTLSGEFGPERRIPAIGPAEAPGLDDPSAPLVSLDMSPERAMLLRVVPVTGLPALTGLRLPLVSGAEGAEVRLAPWSNAGPGRVQPAEAMPKLTGDPVVLDPGGEPWQTYPFGGPLEIDPENAPWVAVLVTRGTASVGLSAEPAAAAVPGVDSTPGPVVAHETRVGPPSGPWRTLPALFGTPRFAGLRLPYRVIGEAGDTAVLTPLVVGAEGTAATLPIDPAPRGARFTLGGLATTAPRLSVTHFVGGEIDLADVDIIFDR